MAEGKIGARDRGEIGARGSLASPKACMCYV